MELRQDNSTGDLEARIEILENDVDHLEDNFDILQEEMWEVQDALILLESEVLENTNQIAELEITDANLLERVSSLENQINGRHLFPCNNFIT